MEIISKWLVGSSNSKKLASESRTLASATLDFSPPESTPIFLNTSSLVNKNDPAMLLSSFSVLAVPVCCNSASIVRSSCRASSCC
mmetsp:Transcript_6174/g.13875  ORF Transcript_6174/g.13875 Transcript_6174/m.13875 type:complete len:85 (-) Transcript_6174:2114-2368(-)